ncbi:DUF1730 domain-containing protein [Candidatus Poribacteria bacterium]|nr:DUF1730 domain-containing protein [Candidatus Poribacteria bacterium]
MADIAPGPLREAVSARARQLGFDGFGVARAEPLEDEGRNPERWSAEDRHATMEWRAREPRRRADPAVVLPGCQSVIVVTLNYLVAAETAPSGNPAVGKVSKYARGRDYHRVMDKGLRKLARFLNHHGGPGTHSKPYVDHGPVMERQWAARAGLGFLGKHTLLIHPDRGS